MSSYVKNQAQKCSRLQKIRTRKRRDSDGGLFDITRDHVVKFDKEWPCVATRP